MNVKSVAYRAVSIRTAKNTCCQAVTEVEGQRFLCEEAPMLPLNDCSNPERCRCRYKHYDDRREDDRRLMQSHIGAQYYANGDRRKGRDRRS